MSHVMNFLAESVLTIPDEEILSLVEEEGRSVPKLAASVRELLKSQVQFERQRALHDAMAEYQRQVRAAREQTFLMPASLDGKRELLASVFSRFPQMENTFLTVQHREFKELSAKDIESLLHQLGALGVFDEGKA